MCNNLLLSQFVIIYNILVGIKRLTNYKPFNS